MRRWSSTIKKASAFDEWGGAALERPVSDDSGDELVRFFKQVSTMGRVPAIGHDGSAVYESVAIITYLAETFPEADLAPTPEESADYYR